jgi:hypothetical protein
MVPGLLKLDWPCSFDERSVVEDAVAAVDRDGPAAAGEGDGLADPVAGVGAGEDRVLEDGVEAVSLLSKGACRRWRRGRSRGGGSS